MYKKRTAYSFVIIAAALWGTIGIFSKHLSAIGFSALQIVSIRAIISALFIFALLLVKDRRLLKIEIRDSGYFAGTGIISIVFFNWCYFTAINKTSLSVAAILLYTAPAFVMVFSAILFKEKLTKRKIAALILTFIGCLFVTVFVNGTGHEVSALGILAGLGSGLGYALYSIFGRYALRKYDSYTVTFYTFVFASIFLIPTSNIRGIVSLLLNDNALFYAILLSLIATVFPFLLYTKGLSQLETSKASIIATLEPVVATVIGIVLFNEAVSIFKIVGILLVVFAVAILREKSEKDMDVTEEKVYKETDII